MTRRQKRLLLRIAAAVVGVLILAVIAGIQVVRSRWFYEKVRLGVVAAVENASGGRVEIGQFHFDWKRMRVEVRSFTLHGKEAAGKPPLFRASSVALGFRIVSFFKREIDLQYLDVADPRIYLIVYPDGSTNIPEPKIKRRDRSTMERILDLAIDRFNLQNGTFEVESRGKTEFDARGQNLNARFDYDMVGPRYRGNLSIQPLDLRIPDQPLPPASVVMALTLEKNRIGFASAKATTRESSVDFSGAIEDLNQPRISIHYNARAAVPEASRLLKLEELKAGTVRLEGDATWSKGPGFHTSGQMHAEHVDYRDSTLRLDDWRADADFELVPGGMDLGRVKTNGTYVAENGNLPVSTQVSTLEIRGKDLDLSGVALQAMGGSFQGEARVRNLDRLTVKGEIKDFLARQTVALYSKQALPWDTRVSGTVDLETSLRQKKELRAALTLGLRPAPGSAPVYGQINARYDAATNVLDLGRSNIMLPHSRVDFSGAIGRTLRVHAEISDLSDILPVLGANAASFPVTLQNGAVIFDGTVTGNLERPRIDGRVSASRFSIEGTPVDSLTADVTVSPENARLINATVTKGALNASLQAAIDLQNWKASDASMIFGEGSIRNAPLADLAALAGGKSIPATGTVTASAQFSGTVGKPLVRGELDINKGTLYEEPFDRVTAKLDYDGNRAELTDVILTAGPKQMRLSATYQPMPGRFDTGRLHFEVASNDLPLDQIQTFAVSRPGVKGTMKVTAAGDLDLSRAADGSVDARLMSLNADVTGTGLQVAGEPLGNAHLVATSQGQTLRAQLDATFAESQVRGEGEWRLAGDYPGEAGVTFSRLDLAQLRSWLAPSSRLDRLGGFVEGELRISGPLRRTEALRATLRLPKVVIGSKPGAGLPVSYSIENAEPVVVRLANSAATVESARFTGRESDISVSGKVVLQPKTALDLRVDGKIGLPILHELDPAITASGVVTADATVRGDFGNPQINGRMQFDNAAFNVSDFPSGISKASGVIVFNKDRATIQSLTGETGGGKVEVTGFYAYGGAVPVFNLAAKANQVRVRYPEGVSTVSNADLTLIGNLNRSRLGGTVTIVRAGFKPESDFGSIFSQSSEPVRTPSSGPGLLGGMTFDVKINADPDMQFQSTLTQDLQMDANLQLRGTPANPVMIGRVNITQGEVLFQGTTFTINQGSISFYNTSKIEPILDVDLETRARGIDITLTVSGPLNKLTLTPRSDPPLQFQEIVELLATGTTPSSDPARLAQLETAPQSWQRMGASALLGQVVTNPVSGRLQRFFGVSKLKIDPTLPGVETNLQARLTLEQQVTRDVTLTYITNVTSSNPQILRLEWAVTKEWSIVALREESGAFGLDFFFKKRF